METLHEAGIAQALVEQVLEQLEKLGNPGPVQSVEVSVGVLSGVLPEALEFAFSVLSADSPLGQARLVIREIPAQCRCLSCGGSTPVKEWLWNCPLCGAAEVRIEGGRDLRLEAIEIAEDKPQQGGSSPD
jgi:hydrogenase nickel incorporation protein HypA/HybF